MEEKDDRLNNAMVLAARYKQAADAAQAEVKRLSKVNARLRKAIRLLNKAG